MSKKVYISDERCLLVFPGCLASIHDQYSSLINARDAKEEEIAGRLSIFVYNCAQCIELFLKYKIQKEKKDVHDIHNLLTLFKNLSLEGQNSIRKSFSKLKVKHQVPPSDFKTEEARQNYVKTKRELGLSESSDPIKWNKVDDILEQIKNASVNWRYIVEKEKAAAVDILRLYLLVISVYNTLD